MQPLTGRTARQGGVLGVVRRTYPLPVEMLLLVAVVAVWQVARIPFEASIGDAVQASRDWIDAEQAVGIAIEPDVVSWASARPDLLAAANWFYSHMDETLVFGAFAALRLLDALRYPAVRTEVILSLGG